MTINKQSNSARKSLLSFALMLTTLPAALSAQNVGFVEHVAPAPASPTYITTGPDGALWSTGQTIVRTTTAGVSTQYSIPTDTFAYAITTGSDGALWFTEQANKIGRITTSGIVTEFPIPAPDFVPQGIAAGPDGALWFTAASGAIGRVTTSGVFTSYPIPSPNSLPQWITPGPDGALWFTELVTDKIGRITTAGVITEYPVPTGTAPEAITTGPDGALWFTGEIQSVGRMTTAGAVTLYPVNKKATLRQITSGPDGALWFTDEIDSLIGRITTSGVVTEYATPTKSFNVAGITTGPDNTIWFTEYQTENSSKFGQAILQTAVLSGTPDTGIPGTQVTLSGSGFAPNETVNLYANSTSANLVDTAFADSTGAFVVSQTIHQSPYGPSSITGVGQTSGHIGIAPFSTLAHVTISPSAGPAGSTILMSGDGFAANSFVFIDGGPGFQVYLASGGVDSLGTFAQAGALSIRIPVGTPPGQYQMLAHGTQVYAGAYFTVQ